LVLIQCVICFFAMICETYLQYLSKSYTKKCKKLGFLHCCIKCWFANRKTKIALS